MTRGLERHYGAKDLHFITSTCYSRLPLLATAARRDLFLEILEKVRRRYAFVILGYVVMPEHFHFLVSEPDTRTLSDVMKALKLGFTRRVIEQNERESGFRREKAQHLWLHRFYDFNVCTEDKRIEKLRYLHRNPVKRGLVASPELWKWSSFRCYAFDEPGVVKINQWDVLRLKVCDAVRFGDRRKENSRASASSPTSRKSREVGHPVILKDPVDR